MKAYEIKKFFRLNEKGKSIIGARKETVNHKERVERLSKKKVINKIKRNESKAEVREIRNGYAQIAKFREKARLQPYSLESGDTVAMVKVNGRIYHGVNSGITENSRLATRDLRNKWLNEVDWVPPKKNAPKHLGQVQSLTHAESHALIRAYERQGALPQQLTMYVDRVTCNICRGEMPALLKRVGVDELTIYSGGSTNPLIIKAIK